jgi:hypothetical protein
MFFQNSNRISSKTKISPSPDLPLQLKTMGTTQTHNLDFAPSPFGKAYPNDSEALPDFMDPFFVTDPQEPLVNDFDFGACDSTLDDKGTISDVKADTPKRNRKLLPRNASDLRAHAPLTFAALPNGCPDSAINTSLIDIHNRLLTVQNTVPTFRQMYDLSTRLTSMEARQARMENRQTEMESRHISVEARQTTMETRQETMETEPGGL